MVIIDSKMIFMGGIDLCFGRYEYPRYPLTEPVQSKTHFRGQDYSNPRIYDFENVGDFDRCLVDKSTQPRMPWRDIAIQMKGPIVRGMKRHFLQFWNFNNVQFSYKNSNMKLQDGEPIGMDMDKILKRGRKDESVGFIDKFQKAAEETLFRKKQDNLKKELMEMDGTADDKKESQQKRHKRKSNETEIDIEFEDRSDEDVFEENDENDTEMDHIGNDESEPIDITNSGNFICQGLRSGSLWSIGLPVNMTEYSIQKAYIDLISKSKHFVYIENQFFISSTAGEPVTNKVIQVLADRILKAIDEKQSYVAYIVIPMLPGFGGNICEKDGQLLRIQIEWHLKTIYQSPKSLIKQVMAKDPNWQKYIKIYGLRNHALMNDIPVSEIVYVHSKLIIVDDIYALLGSANINDRSMRGDRDSELAILVEEKVKVKGILNGEEVEKSNKVREFRITCWRSLFELEIDYEDPLNQNFQQKVDTQAEINENFYFKLFGFYPHNSFKNFSDILVRKEAPNREYYDNNKESVIGFLLPYPVHFLENEESLKSKFHDLGTTLMPEICFT